MLKSELVIEEPVDVHPRWLRVAAVSKYYSIPRSRVYELLNEGALRTAVLKKKGNQRGIRLICATSLESLLSTIAKLQCIDRLALSAEVFATVPAKFIEQFRARCATESIRELRRHPPVIRYSMVAMFCWRRRQQLTDLLLDLLL